MEDRMAVWMVVIAVVVSLVSIMIAKDFRKNGRDFLMQYMQGLILCADFGLVLLNFGWAPKSTLLYGLIRFISWLFVAAYTWATFIKRWRSTT